MKVGSYRVRANWDEIKVLGGLAGGSAAFVSASYATGHGLDHYTAVSIESGSQPMLTAYTFAGGAVLLTAALILVLIWMLVSSLVEIEEVTHD